MMELTKPGFDPVPCQNVTCRSGKYGSTFVEGDVDRGDGVKVPVKLFICDECAAPILKGREAHQHYSISCKR